MPSLRPARPVLAAVLVASAVLPTSAAAVVTESSPVPAVLAAATTSPRTGTYLAQAGDTWEYIAPRLGVTLDSLLAANGATVATPVRAGQAIVVPASSLYVPATARTGTPYSGPLPASTQGPRVTVVGDSIALGATSLMNLEMPGITVDAKEGRTFAEGLVRAGQLKAEGRLGDVVVLGLGVNTGGATATQVRQAMDLVGPGRELVLVTASGPVAWRASTNQAMRDLAARYPDRVVVADWEAASAYVTDFRTDMIHPRQQGLSIYARLVRLAVDRAAAASTSYTVKAGDGWYAISRVTGVPLTQLLSVNGATLSTVLHPGQVLRLPTPATAGFYTVKAGDGWYAISRATGVPVSQLLSLNGATLTTVLHAGQVLRTR